MLSTVLSELVEEGLIEKQIFGEIPVRVEYKVTGKRTELTDLMSMLCKWGKNAYSLRGPHGAITKGRGASMISQKVTKETKKEDRRSFYRS